MDKLSDRLEALADEIRCGAFSTRPVFDVGKDQARLRWEIGNLVYNNLPEIIAALKERGQ